MRFFVAGEPKALARPRAVRAGEHARVYQEKAPWYAVVAYEAAQGFSGPPLEGPVRVRLGFHMKRLKKMPKTYEKPHIVKPDVDNLVKCVLDAVTGILIRDDTQVVHLVAHKQYALPDARPGCYIEIAAAAAEEE